MHQQRPVGWLRQGFGKRSAFAKATADRGNLKSAIVNLQSEINITNQTSYIGSRQVEDRHLISNGYFGLKPGWMVEESFSPPHQCGGY
jgi:hypothetical protein